MTQVAETRPVGRRVVIVGCGTLGASVASRLAEQGHVVHVLDVNAQAFDGLPPGTVAEGRIVPLVGDGTLENDLRRAAVQDAHILIAVCGRDARNALVAQLAKRLFEVPLAICRVDDPARQEMYNGLDILAISANTLVSNMILVHVSGG